MTVTHDELPRHGGLSPEDAEFLASFSDERKNKVLWKVDVSLITPSSTQLGKVNGTDTRSAS
jgi:hypothetical protein